MLDSGCLCCLSETRSLADGRCSVEVVQEVRKLVATSQKVSCKLGHPSRADASRKDGRLFCGRVDESMPSLYVNLSVSVVAACQSQRIV